MAFSELDPSNLIHRVKIERRVEVSDLYGQPEPDGWQEVKTYWANVKPLNGRELVNARELKATTTHQILLRGSADVKTTDRIVFNGRIFGIDSIIRADERSAFLIIQTTESSASQ